MPYHMSEPKIPPTLRKMFPFWRWCCRRSLPLFLFGRFYTKFICIYTFFICLVVYLYVYVPTKKSFCMGSIPYIPTKKSRQSQEELHRKVTRSRSAGLSYPCHVRMGSGAGKRDKALQARGLKDKKPYGSVHKRVLFFSPIILGPC